MMTPFMRFRNGLHQVRADFNEQMEEMTAFAEVMCQKQNTLELDENGFFYVTAAGPIDDVIKTLHKQIDKLERIRKQKDNQR